MAYFQFPHFYCSLSIGKETFTMEMTDRGTDQYLPLIYFVYVQLWSNVGSCVCYVVLLVLGVPFYEVVHIMVPLFSGEV